MSDREDQEQQRRLRQDWDDAAAANLAYQQQQEEERDVNQYRRSDDRDAVEGVAWVIGALIGLAFVVPVMAAVLIWHAVVWTVRWMMRER
ncbi:MAG: hypothetical protein IPO43_13660 [Rhodoferax sp.]|nr:hypothetical protein [Rhodoferax sp.]